MYNHGYYNFHIENIENRVANNRDIYTENRNLSFPMFYYVKGTTSKIRPFCVAPSWRVPHKRVGYAGLVEAMA